MSGQNIFCGTLYKIRNLTIENNEVRSGYRVLSPTARPAYLLCDKTQLGHRRLLVSHFDMNRDRSGNFVFPGQLD